jgi:hypothetical protein
MPKSASTVNQTLTNYAHGVSQDMASALAEFIAPTVPVSGTNGQFKKFSDKNAFQVYDTSRAVGGSRKRIKFDADDPYYNAKPQGLEIPIDDHEEKASGTGDPLKLRQAKTKTLVSTGVNSHEAKVFSALESSVSAVAGKGVWSTETVDPVSQLDEQIEAIATATGRMPNRIVFGLGAWRVFRDHPLVKARQPGAELISVNEKKAASMMLNPEMEIRVGLLSKDTSKFGAGKNAVNIVGAKVYIFYAETNPTEYDPSFMKTFMPDGDAVESVREYRDEQAVSDILALDWAEDIQVVAEDLCRRIDIS